MADPKKLLIAVDGSQQSLEAVSYVALNLRSADLRVNLMYVLPTVPEALGDLGKEGFFKKKLRAKHDEWKRSEQKAAQIFLQEARNLLLKANVREDDVRVILQKRQV
ncbi:MAG: universal stress protein, partial [Desulfobacterales bacterium]|nr:universal stress protein [Desulfobacterales bacterium]